MREIIVDKVSQVIPCTQESVVDSSDRTAAGSGSVWLLDYKVLVSKCLHSGWCILMCGVVLLLSVG